MLLKEMKFAQTRKTVLLLLKTKKLLYIGLDFQNKNKNKFSPSYVRHL